MRIQSIPVGVLSVLVLAAGLQTPKLAFASGGASGVGGGGDLCEDRIQFIRDEIKQWIVKGGPKGLELPDEVKLEDYSKNMKDALDAAKIRCVRQGDPGFPVVFKGAPKTCVFHKDDETGTSDITCDFDKFQSIPESDQYVLIHHEYAGIAKMETPDQDVSHYPISNQITGYLVDEVVKKLSVSPQDASEMILPASEACSNEISEYEASVYSVKDKKLNIDEKGEMHQLLNKAVETCMRPFSSSQKLILFQAASASGPEGLLVFLKVNQGKVISLREIQEEKSLGVRYDGAAFEFMPETKECKKAIAKYDAIPGSFRDNEDKDQLANDLLVICTQKMSKWAQDILIDSQFWEETGYNRAGLIKYVKNSMGKVVPVAEIAETHRYPANR